MTQLLISVKNVQEAAIALEWGADIIDLKDPNTGALGALPFSEIESIIRFIDARKLISATIGDIPMEPIQIKDRVVQLLKLPLSFIKIGFFEAHDYQPCLNELHQLMPSGSQLIAVLFAELQYPTDLILNIKKAGFSGVMLDTMLKNGKTYQAYYSLAAFKSLVSHALTHELLFGLAGSLQLADINVAKKMTPHFMGFRGGVCLANERQSVLDGPKIGKVRDILQQ